MDGWWVGAVGRRVCGGKKGVWCGCVEMDGQQARGDQFSDKYGVGASDSARCPAAPRGRKPRAPGNGVAFVRPSVPAGKSGKNTRARQRRSLPWRRLRSYF